MLVGERMTTNPITTTPDTPVTEARKIMKQEKIRRLPVVNKKGELMGIVSDQDLLNVSPSPATLLSVWEINDLLSKLTIGQVMTEQVITVTEDVPLEDAARIMADNKIGGLPVVRGKTVVGIITETDLFKIFIELFAARQRGIRLNLLIPAIPGVLAKITSQISSLGGNILALGVFWGDDPTNGLCTLKVEGVDQATLVDALTPHVLEIVDARAV